MKRLIWLFHFLFFFFQYQSACSLSPLTSSPSSNHLCSLSERSSLLQFKQMFTINSSASSSCDELGSPSYQKTLSWNETTNTDCCSWDGVTCDVSIGHVTGLDLSCSKLYGTIHPNTTLFQLSHLQQLNLAFNHFNFSPFPPSFSRFTSLSHLNLSSSFLSGSIPSEITHLSKLVSLDLSFNSMDDMFLQPGKLRLELHNFKALLMNLTQLENLKLARVNISSGLPDSLLNLSSLSTLNLANTGLNGKLPYSIGYLGFLNYLDLSGNELSGPLPESLGNLTRITVLRLWENNLNGQVPSTLSNLEQLTEFRVGKNNLNGTIPEFFSKLIKLEQLILSANNFSGPFPSWVANLTQLVRFGIFSNPFTAGPIPNYNISGFRNLQFLDLSDCSLNGTLPSWLFTIPSLHWLYVHSNQLTGQIPEFRSDSQLEWIHLSNLSSLRILVLSNNNLSGVIPHCLGNVSNYLEVLDLRSNGFHGAIPTTFANGSEYLRSLYLNGNHLEGPVPQSLANCKSMEVLDLGNNDLYGAFPHWLESLPELQVLVLKSNRLHGPIGNFGTKAPFPKLRIFDISQNNFTGLLPERYFLNFKAMMNVDKSNTSLQYMGRAYYIDSMELVLKGVVIKLERILTVFTTIDLSYNNFRGEIPSDIGKLQGLRLLNLSHNSLSGHLPSLLRNITVLESLDLSSNQLTGKIPRELTSLTFLAFLNFSKNHLVGPIPHGNQFDTFQNDSYVGNLGLCGLPLSKKCGDSEAPPQPISPDDDDDDNFTSGCTWRIVLMGYGCGLVIGVTMGFVMFLTGRPRWFTRISQIGWRRSHRS